MKRSAGILMPISSLPSPYGIGTMGQAARDFIDFCEKSGQSYWQVLPIGPTGYGDSPYQSFSSNAGNPYFIDLDDLCAEGYLKKDEYVNEKWGSDPGRVDYGQLYVSRFPVLRKAVARIAEVRPEGYNTFLRDNAYWLNDYALFMAEKDAHGGQAYTTWEEDIRMHRRDALVSERVRLQKDVDFYIGIQYLFFMQWKKMREYAHAHGVSLIGDVPIYVSPDSSDIWGSPEFFQLDEELKPTGVAGCPPDAFAADGQLWGNPLYDWDRLREDGYTWWVNRVRYQFEFVDVLRIDHFRGFESYFCIPYGDTTARNGVWKKGPGAELFRTIEQRIGKVDIIAEDLGFLTPEVIQMVKDTGYPGMKVLQFAFDPRDTGSGYLPHLYTPNSVVYPGTHDNQTITSWMSDSPEGFADHAIEYLHLDKKEGYNWGFIRSSYGSVSQLCVVQMQDILGLDDKARMNIPSTTGGNWTWRASKKHFTDALAAKMHRMSEIYGRLPEKKEEPSVDTDVRPAVETA